MQPCARNMWRYCIKAASSSSEDQRSDWPSSSLCSSQGQKQKNALMCSCACGCRGSRTKLVSPLCSAPWVSLHSHENWWAGLRSLRLSFGVCFQLFVAWRNTAEQSHSSCSHHPGNFLWINHDLTWKCKQIDRPESGYEIIYCCEWNVRNAVLKNDAKQERFFYYCRLLWPDDKKDF